VEIIEVPEPEMTPLDKINFAIEVGFNNLIESAKNSGLPIAPVAGLMYLPDQSVTRQFQEACRAVIASLGGEVNAAQ
jgi:hypothetical protein